MGTWGKIQLPNTNHRKNTSTNANYKRKKQVTSRSDISSSKGKVTSKGDMKHKSKVPSKYNKSPSDKRLSKDKERTGKKGKGIIKQSGAMIKAILKWFLLLVLIGILILLVVFYMKYGKTLLEYQTYAKKQVQTTQRSVFSSSLTSLVYDSDGSIISKLKGERDVYYIEFENIPRPVIDAMISTEDKKFLSHQGLDYLANIRAAVALIKEKGKITQGGSTITQQLARNIYLTHEVSLERKLKEIFLAIELEKKYTKSEIMEFYLNNIYYANGYYGIQAASMGYFSKGIHELSLSQIAFLCAIPNNPTMYDPVTNYTNTIQRRDRILMQMLEDGLITEEDHENALKEKIELTRYQTKKQNYVETYVYHCAILALMEQGGFSFQDDFESEEEEKEYLENYYHTYHAYQSSLYTAGYRIYTSVDSKMQEQLQNSVDSRLENFTEKTDEGIYTLQGSAVCIDNSNGKVVAIVGGRSSDYHGYTLNRAYQSFRQPGSAIKPLIVYTPALERGYHPDTKVLDEKFEGGPRNSGNRYEGEITLLRAVEASKNTIAWKLFEEITPKVGLSYLKKMNFEKVVARDYVPAASLGGFTYGVSAIEMAAGYASISNDGYYRNPTCIISIMDSEGNEIVSDQSKGTRVYTEVASKMMTEMLESVMVNGTGKKLRLKGISCAGKTGTTDKKKDGWFVGYTPYYTTSVWVGYDMPKELDDLAGSTYPGQIWNDYMSKIHSKDMTESFSYYDYHTRDDE